MRPLVVVAALTLVHLAAADAAHAQGGLVGRMRRRAEEALAGAHERKGGLPAGFARPEYALTETRVAAILRGAERATAAAARNRELQAAASRTTTRAPSADEAAAAAHARCTLAVGAALSAMRLGRNGAETDATRRRLLELQQRAERMNRDLEAQQRAGRPIDERAAMRTTLATTDTIARLLGKSCPPPPESAWRLGSDEDDETERTAREGPLPGEQNPDSVFRSASGLDDRQWGEVRDKLIAFFEAGARDVAPAGFADDEVRALRAALPALQRYRAQLQGQKGW